MNANSLKALEFDRIRALLLQQLGTFYHLSGDREQALKALRQMQRAGAK